MPDIVAAAPIKGFRAPGVTELTDQPQSSTVVAPAASAAPIGTRAGPGEIFDAEPSGNGSSARKQKAAGGAPTARRSRKRTWWIVAAVAAAVIIAGGLLAAFESQVFTPSHPVPTLVDQPLAKAQAEVTKLHMTLKQGAPVKSIPIAAGSVVNQSPKPGTSLKEGSTITVFLSAGPPDVAVPNLANMTCAQAGATLQTVHLNATCTPGAYNDNVAAELIISWSVGNSQNPTEAPYGSTITIVPSLGHQPATVPDIPNTYTFAQAQAALQAVGLSATQATQPNATVAAGDVISTTPASGAPAPYGSAVTVTVSSGPPTTQVPNVIGDTVQQADGAAAGRGPDPGRRVG